MIYGVISRVTFSNSDSSSLPMAAAHGRLVKLFRCRLRLWAEVRHFTRECCVLHDFYKHTGQGWHRVYASASICSTERTNTLPMKRPFDGAVRPW